MFYFLKKHFFNKSLGFHVQIITRVYIYKQTVVKVELKCSGIINEVLSDSQGFSLNWMKEFIFMCLSQSCRSFISEPESTSDR